MTTHYVVDLFDNTVKRIRNDPSANETPLGGEYVVMTPFDLGPISDPSDIPSEKLAALQNLYSGYANVDQVSGIDAGNSEFYTSGGLAYTSLLYQNSGGSIGLVQYDMLTLSGTPTRALVLQETFQYVDEDPQDGVYTKTFRGEYPDATNQGTADVSFNNGGTFFSITMGVAFDIDLADQGDEFILKVTNTAGSRVYLGSAFVLY